MISSAQHAHPEFLKAEMGNGPDMTVERKLQDRGLSRICGVDEAGRGPLAGPVVCAAVVLDPNDIPTGLRDSKRLNAATRRTLHAEVCRTAEVSVVLASAATIDRLNIRTATLRAMAIAVSRLSTKPDAALIDGNALPPDLDIPAWCMVKGDDRSSSIAAASIVAKTIRDDLMLEADSKWPAYGFAAHKGYPTKAHRAALTEFGPCPIHRRSFAPVREATTG